MANERAFTLSIGTSIGETSYSPDYHQWKTRKGITSVETIKGKPLAQSYRWEPVAYYPTEAAAIKGIGKRGGKKVGDRWELKTDTGIVLLSIGVNRPDGEKDIRGVNSARTDSSESLRGRTAKPVPLIVTRKAGYGIGHPKGPKP